MALPPFAGAVQVNSIWLSLGVAVNPVVLLGIVYPEFETVKLSKDEFIA